MDDTEHAKNLYLHLPDDPELAFATLQQIKYAELQRASQESGRGDWSREEEYLDTLTAFDQVYNLGLFADFGTPPNTHDEFYEFFNRFSRHAAIASQKFQMEAARRIKTGAQTLIIIDAPTRQAIHALINAIKEKLNKLTLTESKRESLFNKLNEFAEEVDRNRTRTEAFFAFAVEATRNLREFNKELKLLQQPIDRICDFIEKADKWKDALPPWENRKQIEGPPKQLVPPQEDSDDDIPF